MNDTHKLRALNTRLQAAIEAKDKRAILVAYDSAGTLDLEKCDDAVFAEYDRLGDTANDILYSYPPLTMAIHIKRYHIPDTRIGLAVQGILNLIPYHTNYPSGAAMYFNNEIKGQPRYNAALPEDYYKAELNDDETECKIIRKAVLGKDKLLALITYAK